MVTSYKYDIDGRTLQAFKMLSSEFKPVYIPLKNIHEPQNELQNEPQKVLIRKQSKLNRCLTIVELIEKDVTITREQITWCEPCNIKKRPSPTKGTGYPSF